MKVLLVGNYPFDGSMSMKVWAGTLERELRRAGVKIEMIAPLAVFGQWKPSADGIGKWLGYIDRFLLFPARLKRVARRFDLVHLCDHGSAVYVRTLRKVPTVVTCHDLLAIRGALGEVPDCKPSRTGNFFQNWIRHGLLRADRVACVSQYTYQDAQRILAPGRNLCVVLNGLNYPFRELDRVEVQRRLRDCPNLELSFVLHIGSNQARKNREGVLRAFALVPENVVARLVLAGPALSPELLALARTLGIAERVVPLVRPNVEVVEALYNQAVALLFPSRYEGFGWPPIEAQACGCPVVGSDISPLREVLGDSAVLKGSADAEGMAEALVRIATDRSYRNRLRDAGRDNVRARFGLERMIGDYMALYKELLCTRRP